MHRIFLAIILGMNMGLAVSQPKIAFLVQLAIIILLLVGGFTRWCVGLEILKSLLPPCKESQKERR
jgi:hypothetical protein